MPNNGQKAEVKAMSEERRGHRKYLSYLHFHAQGRSYY